METEYIYWRHRTPVGIRVEEVSGAEQRKGRVWREMAMQVYKENGRDGYRDIGHYPSGAPFLYGDNSRISVSHTDGLLVVATLPKTPEADLSLFNTRTAMGIDTERSSRSQVIGVRGKFLSDKEMEMVPESDLALNVLAWTCKEAAYKAALTEGLDCKEAIRLLRLPGIEEQTLGEALVITPEGEEIPLLLYSYLSDDFIVTLAFHRKCAKFMKDAVLIN